MKLLNKIGNYSQSEKIILERILTNNFKKIDNYKNTSYGNGIIILINGIGYKGSNPIQAKIFSLEDDFLKYFCPLKKLNDIESNNKLNQNIVVNNIIDYNTELKIIIEDKLIVLDDIFLDLIITSYKIKTSNDSPFESNSNIKIIISRIFKSFFRSIFLLYMKNDQVNTTLTLKNFGTKNLNTGTKSEISKFINEKNIDDIRFLSTNFTNSIYLKGGRDSNSAIKDSFAAKRFLYESFKFFRVYILKKLVDAKGSTHSALLNGFNSVPVLQSNTDSQTIIEKVYQFLRKLYDELDETLTDKFSTDKIIRGQVEYNEFRVFKFLNYDDILIIISKKIDLISI